MKKLKEKSLKSLLTADFMPLTQTAEGELRGGFLAVQSDAVDNCDCHTMGNNCSCPPNGICPEFNHVNSNCVCPKDTNGNNLLDNCDCYLFNPPKTTTPPASASSVTFASMW